MRIYVASLADYSAGILHGAWIDCEGKTADELQEEVNAMLAESKQPVAEEWAIHDYEGFGGIELSEHTSLKCLSSLVSEIGGLHDDEEREAFFAFVGNIGTQADIEQFRDSYMGRWDDVEEYVYSIVEEMGLLKNSPEIVGRYFDYKAFARDMELGGEVWTARASKGGVHIFDNL